MEEIVLVDDDTEILQVNHKYLQKSGYNVKSFSSSKRALDYLKEKKTSCVVLDVMMPEMNGFTMCQKLREFSQVPVIFLTGKTEEEDKIKGLLIGAEDYMVKPYSLKELSARIMVQLRRKQAEKTVDHNIIEIASLRIDLERHKVFFKDEEMILSNREFELLVYLAKHPGESVSFEEIGMNMWNQYAESDRRVIMVTMSRLRKKLEEYTGCNNMIETVWSVGYKFVAA